MSVLLIIFGALTFITGVAIVMDPDRIFGFLNKQLGKVTLHVLNVVIRVIFGVLMISYASISQFPFVVETIGWFCIAIAVILTFMGRERFNRVIAWAVSLVETNHRLGGVLVAVFGAFLIYAFV